MKVLYFYNNNIANMTFKKQCEEGNMDDTFIQSLKYYSLSSVCLPCPLAHPVVSGACLYIVEVDKITTAKKLHNILSEWVYF